MRTALQGTRGAAASLVTCCIVAWSSCALGSTPPAGGEAGFVVHGMGNALALPGQIESMCPAGRSRGYVQIYEHGPEGGQRDGESAAQYRARVNQGAFALAEVQGGDLCAHPELGESDPHYKLMTATEVVSFGIDLDGRASTAGDKPTATTCPHDDFPGTGGRSGVDNQMARVVGCDGAGEQYAAADETGDLPSGESGVSEMMLQGGWGILVALRGLDSYENDDDVAVGLYANADPIVLSAAREPIPFATYASDQDPRFRAETRGRIVDGVLTTDPVDVRFHWLVAGLHLERPLRDARLEVTFNEAGGLQGYLAGYTPVEAMYDINYGFRSAVTDAGEPAKDQVKRTLAVLGNSVMGRTCHGAYAAMYQLADADPDPKTGRCRSISTQYWIRATPAFVVDAETESVNDALRAP